MPLETIAAVVAAGAGATQAGVQVLQALNQPRSVMLEVDNNTSVPLNRLSDHQDHGGFAVTPESVIPPRMADIFGAQSSGGSLFTGTEGGVRYAVDGVQLEIAWDDPFFGDNSGNAVISGPNVAKYRVVTTVGVGNANAHMRYELFERVLANFSAQRHAGNPVLIQSRFGERGNFELLVPLDPVLAAYFRDNDAPGLPWGGPVIFGTEVGRIDGVTMIESNFGSPGNLEVIARVGDRLKFFFRDSRDLKWSGPFGLAVNGVEVTGVTGNPALIQSRFGQRGNFELAVPLVNGGLALFFRDNDKPGLPWVGPANVGSNHYAAVTMIQSNFGSPGDLEVVASNGTGLDFFFRDSGPAFRWSGPFGIDGLRSPVKANPALIQSRFGIKGNFELIAPQTSSGDPPGNGIVHLFRDNDDPALPWKQSTVFGIGSRPTDRIDAVTMIESNFGSLEVIARIGERLAFFFRDGGPSFTWNGPFFI